MLPPASRMACVTAVLILAGCQGVVSTRQPGTPGYTLTATQTAPTLVITTTPPIEGGADPATPQSEEIVLTVWVTEDHAPTSETPGGTVFLEQLTAFDETRPDIRVNLLVKSLRGEGSALAYLRTAPPVAPGALPDLLLLDREGLIEAGRDGLVAPVESLADPIVLEGLYPAAREVGTVDGTLVGLPYLLDFLHSVYRQSVVAAPPQSTADVLALHQPYAFAAGSLSGVNSVTLLQYMSAGGIVIAEDGTPVLDQAVLADVLTFYDQAHARGILDTAFFQVIDPAQTFALYRERQVNLAAVLSSDYLTGRESLRSTGVASVPTPDGQPYTLVEGWSWVVVSADPVQQSAAMALINFLMNPVNQGRYTQSAHWLPSQPSALSVWGDEDRYAAFANQMMENAHLAPDPAWQAIIGEAIQTALEAVLLNGASPAQAAADAAQTVGQEQSP